MAIRRKPATRRRAVTDDEWIRQHFEQLVDRYPGQYAVVAEHQVFVGQNANALFREARRTHPNVIPTGLPIPRPQDFVCAL